MKFFFYDSYSDYLKTNEWKERRDFTKLVDGFACAICGWEQPKGTFSTDRFLAVHHLTYARIGNESPKDLLTLCSVCHEQISQLCKDEEKPISKPKALRAVLALYGKEWEPFMSYVRAGRFLNAKKNWSLQLSELLSQPNEAALQQSIAVLRCFIKKLPKVKHEKA